MRLSLPPGLCLLCRAPATETGLCAACLEDLQSLRLPEPACSHCALPLTSATALCGHCLRLPPAFSLCVAPFCYYYPLDHLIARFKYNGCSASARLLSGLFCQHLEDFYRRSSLPLPQLVLPTPLHWRRHLERGFNQSELLARRAARALGLECPGRLLRRTRATRPQQALSRRDRGANVKGAFAVSRRGRARLAGRRVALVDDVVTSATTVREIARVLMVAGAAEVHVWALARTPG